MRSGGGPREALALCLRYSGRRHAWDPARHLAGPWTLGPSVVNARSPGRELRSLDLPARGSAGRQQSLCLGVLTCQSERGGGTDFRNEKKLSYSAEREIFKMN